MAALSAHPLWVAVGTVGGMFACFAAVAFIFVFVGGAAGSVTKLLVYLLPEEHGTLINALLSEVEVKNYVNMSNVAAAAVFVALVALVTVADTGLTSLREIVRRKSRAPSEAYMLAANPSYDAAFAAATKVREVRKRM